MTTDWRALCEELAHEVEQYAEDRGDLMPECAERARAALAEPVAEWPTDEEIIREAIKADLVYRPVDEEPYVFSGFVESHSLNQYVLAFARAVLARWGHQPAPPAEGEDKAPAVTEVIAWLRTEAEIDDGFELAQSAAYQRRAADLLSQRHPAPPAEGEVGVLLRELRDAAFDLNGSDPAKSMLTRAADLLSIAYATGPEVWEPIPLLPAQRHPTPVPVAERLPGAEDCALWPGEPNAGRWCWMASCVDNGWAWEQRTLGFLASFPQDFTHWLPAHALPLPAGEVE